MKDEEKAYEENVGKPPQNLPEDHPDLWQWRYRGTKVERDALLAELALKPPEEEEVSPDQEELF